LADCLTNLLWPKPPHPLARRGHSSPRLSPNPRHSGLNFGGAGILNLLSIVYAHRPRLRTRLTLGGRTFPRKPWVYGGQEFNLSYRYSCLHPHFPALHRAVTRRLQCTGNAPLPTLTRSRASVYCLSPIIIGAESLDESAITHCLNGGCL
jgi:hypothetical protein